MKYDEKLAAEIEKETRERMSGRTDERRSFRERRMSDEITKSGTYEEDPRKATINNPDQAV